MDLKDILDLKLIGDWNDIISDDKFWCQMLKLKYNVKKTQNCNKEFKKIYKMKLDILDFWLDVEQDENTKGLSLYYPDFSKLENLYKIYLAYELNFLKLTKDLNIEKEELIVYNNFLISSGLKVYKKNINYIVEMINKDLIKNLEEEIQDELVSIDEEYKEGVYLPFHISIVKFKYPITDKNEGEMFLKDIWNGLNATSPYRDHQPNMDDIIEYMLENKNRKWLNSKGEGVKNSLKNIDVIIDDFYYYNDDKITNEEVLNYIGDYYKYSILYLEDEKESLENLSESEEIVEEDELFY
jgi:hypothetical protein